jgi:hypothetical protein
VPAIRIATSAAQAFKTCIAIPAVFFGIWRWSIMRADMAAPRRWPKYGRRAENVHSLSIAESILDEYAVIFFSQGYGERQNLLLAEA